MTGLLDPALIAYFYHFSKKCSILDVAGLLLQLPDVKGDYYFALSMQFLLLFIFYGDCE